MPSRNSLTDQKKAASTIDLTNFRMAKIRTGRQIADGNQTPDGRSQREAQRKIEKVLTYMLQNLDKPIEMPTLGTLAGVSMSHFYHLFKFATGCTPNDFLIHARIRRACELLRETDLSVKEVAAALGYDDQFYFSRLFKSVNSVSPSQYRTAQAGLNGQNGLSRSPMAG